MIIDYSSTHSPITDTANHSSQLQQFSSSQLAIIFLKRWQPWKFYFEQKAQHSSKLVALQVFVWLEITSSIYLRFALTRLVIRISTILHKMWTEDRQE